MLWTAFASVFSLLLVTHACRSGALDGDYFQVFARVHPKHQFPHVSLLVLGAAAIVFCLFRLADVVTALVVIRILTQFLAQTLGIIVLRTTRPDFRARPDVAVSAPGAARVRRLSVHGRDAAEVDRVDQARAARRDRGTILFWLRQRQAAHSS